MEFTRFQDHESDNYIYGPKSELFEPLHSRLVFSILILFLNLADWLFSGDESQDGRQSINTWRDSWQFDMYNKHTYEHYNSIIYHMG